MMNELNLQNMTHIPKDHTHSLLHEEVFDSVLPMFIQCCSTKFPKQMDFNMIFFFLTVRKRKKNLYLYAVF